MNSKGEGYQGPSICYKAWQWRSW